MKLKSPPLPSMLSMRRIFTPLVLATSLHAAEPDTTGKSLKDRTYWSQKEPGKLYKNKENPWIQSLKIGGRMHYQAAWLSGSDELGYDFSDNYDELRRLRLESKTRFLKFLTASLDIDLADDERFQSGASDDLLKGWEDHDLDWGFQGFSEASLELDLGKASDIEWLDKTSLTLGKMKLETGWERRQSSNEIFTLERSDLSNFLGGSDGRPVGLLAEVNRKRWGTELGVFTGSDETNLTGEWDGGIFLLAGASYRPLKDLELRVQHIQAEPSAQDKVLGYASATIIETVYQRDPWGILVDAVVGDNGDEQATDRQGTFGGLVVMPWYWAIEKRLQFVCRYQLMLAEESEGIRTSPRYLRAGHEDALVDINKGRGKELTSLYAGANYQFRGENIKLMTGFSFDRLNTQDGDIYTRTLLFGIRSSF